MSETGRAAEETEYRDLIRSMCEERIFLAAEEVEHYDAARTVRLRAGSLTVSDGPAVKADEFLTGYFVIGVESLETAIDWAARVPNARTGSVRSATGHGYRLVAVRLLVPTRSRHDSHGWASALERLDTGAARRRPAEIGVGQAFLNDAGQACTNSASGRRVDEGKRHRRLARVFDAIPPNRLPAFGRAEYGIRILGPPGIPA